MSNLEVLSVLCEKGRVHDFTVLKKSKLRINPETKKLFDSGYQGVDKFYKNTEVPIKKSKNRPLTKEDKKYNKELSKKRIFIENVNRRFKIFRITKR